MQKEQIYELMTKAGCFFLATAEENIPHVRGMMLYRADEDGIVFHSGIFKPLYHQIKANPAVELCFHYPADGTQVRVAGTLEIVDDNALKDEIARHPSRAFLKSWRDSVSPQDFYDSFMVFRLKGGRANVWTMETNLAPLPEIVLD